MHKAWLGICLSMLALAACSGKKRDFADGVVLPNTPQAAGDASAPAGGTGAATAADTVAATAGIGVPCTGNADCALGSSVGAGVVKAPAPPPGRHSMETPDLGRWLPARPKPVATLAQAAAVQARFAALRSPSAWMPCGAHQRCALSLA